MTTHHQREERSPRPLIHLEADRATQQHEIEFWGEDESEEDEPLLLLLEALANPIRFRLLRLLAKEGGTLCVSELVGRLPRSQPTISHHLRILLFSKLVGVKRLGNYAYYFIRSEKLEQMREAIASIEHLCQQKREDQR